MILIHLTFTGDNHIALGLDLRLWLGLGVKVKFRVRVRVNDMMRLGMAFRGMVLYPL